MKTIVTVVGARPQFIKAAVVSKVLREQYKEILVHTGQHYDYNMSEQFFEEMNIPRPDYNLGIAGGTHAQMTSKMMMALEKVYLKEKPDMVLVYGDTNSTLAAALVAVKLHIPICHVEAGARMVETDKNIEALTNPEEVNRVCTDHVSALLLASTQQCVENLKKENLYEKTKFVGDPMYDAFLNHAEKADSMKHILDTLDGSVIELPERFYYMTCHREENTNKDESLLSIIKVAERMDAPLIYPVHPRNRERAKRLLDQYQIRNLILTNPVGYLTSNYMVRHAEKIVTDSGGLQREAFFAGVQCVTPFDLVYWPEIMVNNRNTLASLNTDDIWEKLNLCQKIDPKYQPFGDGQSAQKIVKAIAEFWNNK